MHIPLDGDEGWVISPTEPPCCMTLGVSPVILSSPPAALLIPAGTTVITGRCALARNV